MKLHLPKQLFTALLAALFAAAIPQTLAGDSLSINFYEGNEKKVGSTTEGQTLFGVDVTDWNDVTATGSQTQQLVVTTAEEKSMLLTLTTPQAAWGPDEAYKDTFLEDKLQASYLDVSAGTGGNAWQIALQGGDAWIMDATFYMAGDGGTYDPLTVNGKTYIGGVDTEGNTAWGERSTNSDGSVSYSTVEGYDGTSAINDVDLNSNRAVRVTSLMGVMTATNASNTDGRGSLAGLQVVDVTDSKVYAATLGSDAAALSEVSWSKQGVETPSTLEGISESERYLSVTADAAGSTWNVAADTTIAGLQLAANSLTVDGSGTLTVGALHAKEGTTLTMNTALAGESLVLSGCGSISLNDFTYTGEVSVLSSTTVQLQAGTQRVGSFVNYGTVKLASGVAPGFLINNSGSVQLQQGSGDLTLNNLVDKDAGTYKPSVITNTASGDIVIDNTGNKSLNANITLANGGKVTLKGGTFGTADAAITYSIQAENTTTLVLDGVEAYLQKTGNTDQILGINTELTNGSVMHLLGNDRLNWGGSFSLTMGLNSLLDVGSTRQSLSGNTLKLAGGTVYGTGGSYSSGNLNYTAGLDYHASGTITTTENSLIATAVAAREADDVVTLDVAADKTLTIGSYTVGDATYTGSFVGSGSFTKTSNGTVLYKGAAFTNTLDVKAGVFEYYVEDERTHTGSITDSGTTSGDTTTYNGIFKKSGSGTLTLDSANTSVTTLNVAGGKLVYNSSTNTTHTISGASGSTFEKTGSGTLTANTSSLASELLISEGTLKLSSAMESDRRATVADGATLDVNGNAAYYNLTLQEGATLTNTHTEAAPDSTGTGKKQLHTITLEGDAKVTGTSQFGMVGNGWGQATLNLNGNTLTKEGSNIFHLYNTRVQSAGLIQVNGGKVITHGGQGSGTLDLTRASIGIDGGEFELGGNSQSIQDLTLTSGSLTIGSGLTLTALGDVIMAGSKTEDTSTGTVTYTSTVSGNLCLSGTITLNGSVNMSGATLSGTSLAGFTLLTSAKPANSGLNSFTYQLWSGDGSVNSSQSTISVGGVNYEMNAATGTFTTAGTVYYVATGDTITVGGDSAAEGTASATSFVVDGTLSVTADTSTESVIGTAGTVNVAESTTLTLTGMGSSIGTLSATNGTVALAAGSSLYLGQTGADAQETTSSIGTVNVAGASTIHLNEKATLSAISKTGNGSITLNGSGTYTLASGASSLGTGVVLGAANSGWTGTVRISSATDNGRIDLNALGNASSTVALAGVYKWVDKNINVNLLLEAHDVAGEPNGFKISGTSGGSSTYNFNGNISGDGDLIIANGNNDTGHRTFKFNGDLSDWEGNLIIGVSPAANNARDATIYLTGPNSGSLVFFSSNDADCGLRVDENHHGTLTVNIGNANNSNTAVMNGTISNLVNGTAQGQLALKVVGSTDFNKDVVVTSAVVNAGKTATITGESNSITAGNVKISQKNASLSNVTVQSGSIAATSTADGATGSISDALVEMQSATSFSISDMVLSNVKLSAVEGASVALTNVSATNTLLAGGGDFTLNATPTVEVAANDTTTGRISYTCGLGVESGSSLTLNLDVINAVRPNQHGTYDLSITLSGFGSGFVIEDNAILGMVKFDASSWLAQALEEQGAEWRAEITEATENTVVTQSSVPTVTYSAGENVGTLVITINGLNVPEPTTATLSLLALAALAARRRRK